MGTMQIFVSHSHSDAPFCHEVVQRLREAGADVWYDEHNLNAGKLGPVIERELRARPIYIVILSPAALASQWVEDETRWAYNRLRRDPTRIILPVVAAPLDEDAIWLFLQEFKRIEAPGVQPWPAPEAARRTVQALALPDATSPATDTLRGPAEEILQHATALVAQHRYKEARPLVDAAVALLPESFAAWAIKARVHDELNDGEAALAAADRALQLEPKSAVALASRGGALYVLDRPGEALEMYEQALTLNPEDSIAWHGKGAALSELKRHEEALAAYEQALTLDPMYSYAWNGKGHTLNDLKRYQEALAAFERATTLDPKDDSAWVGQGNVLYNLKRYDKAAAAYKQVTTLDPKDANAWVGQGNALFYLKRYQEALAAYEQVLTLNPKDANAWNLKGNALFYLKRYQEALAAYEQGLIVAPLTRAVLANKATVLKALGRQADAEQVEHQLKALPE